MNSLTFEASVLRISRLAARQGGTVMAVDVEADEPLARDRQITSAAGHLLAGGVNVVSRPPDDETAWFPYGELTFLRTLPDQPDEWPVS